MKDKINIVKLLKDCPEGMELDCTLFSRPLKYSGLECPYDTFPIRTVAENGEVFWFTKEGYKHDNMYSKCVIFPKGKTTWEGFVPPCKFTDGDIVAAPIFTEGTWMGIFKQCEETTFEVYCSLTCTGRFNDTSSKGHILEGTHLATEEEKQKLLQAIKKNGYKWNAETKVLEKLVNPKFKVGDKIQYNGSSTYRPVYIIKSIEADRYIFTNGTYIKFDDEDKYILLKFDINTLKPFDQVLVRDSIKEKWRIQLFEKYNKTHQYPFKCMHSAYRQCIPYKGNELLLDTKDDCRYCYNTWE
jgi:hypothetical protein